MKETEMKKFEENKCYGLNFDTHFEIIYVTAIRNSMMYYTRHKVVRGSLERTETNIQGLNNSLMVQGIEFMMVSDSECNHYMPENCEEILNETFNEVLGDFINKLFESSKRLRRPDESVDEFIDSYKTKLGSIVLESEK